MDKNGNIVTRYPISYCSKRTSVSKSRYEHFLLEFAALKYSIESYIFGSPSKLRQTIKLYRTVFLRTSSTLTIVDGWNISSAITLLTFPIDKESRIQ